MKTASCPPVTVGVHTERLERHTGSAAQPAPKSDRPRSRLLRMHVAGHNVDSCSAGPGTNTLTGNELLSVVMLATSGGVP